MADDMTPPADLVAARRDFLAADAELTRLAGLAPKPVIEDGRVVNADAELNAQMNQVRTEAARLAAFIADHPWMRASGSWYGAWKKVNEAAKAQPAAV